MAQRLPKGWRDDLRGGKLSTLYHITTGQQLSEAKQTGEYHPPSLTAEGFVHLSQRHQVLVVANLFYRNAADLVCLMIDTDKLRAPLKFESAAHPDGNAHAEIPLNEQFPHLYGPLNMDAIIGVADLEADDQGKFVALKGE